MKRIKKALDQYRKYHQKTGKGNFYLRDVYEVVQMNDTRRGYDVFGLAADALRAGYMIGRRSKK